MTPDIEPVSQPLAIASATGGALSLPDNPDQAAALPAVPVRTVCHIVRQIVAEMIQLASERVQARRDRRRTSVHVRQIAMYVCHVALGLPQQEIAFAFGRDRTTVGHACGVVEDRRDDTAFDDFVSAVERLTVSVFGAAGAPRHG